MKLRTLLATSAWISMAQAAFAQDIWIQIEAHRTLAESNDQALGYAPLLEDLNGFTLNNGWYALSLGPFTREEAQERLRVLRRQGLIPRDSYISDGSLYEERIWPLDSETVASEPIETATAPLEQKTPPTPSTNIQAETLDPLVVEITPAVPEETLRQARASEARLSREERKDLQRAMAWFGKYSAGIDGAFGRGTRAAMERWQEANGFETTGVLTTAQRAQLLNSYEKAQAAIGLAQITVPEAGLKLTAPMGMVVQERIEAPFIHFAEKEGSGLRMVLISQEGDRSRMAGLYEILQTLEDVPQKGARALNRSNFQITGESETKLTQVRVEQKDGHIFGVMLITTPDQKGMLEKVLPDVVESLSSVGAPLPQDAGFDAEEQSLDLVAGLAVRKPKFSRSGVFVNGTGAVVTTAQIAQSCQTITLEQRHEAELIAVDETLGLALLKPSEPITPFATARLAQTELRLRSDVAVASFPYQGLLGAPSVQFGTLEETKGLKGEATQKRLTLPVMEEGAAGGPVLDAQGHVSGILLPRTDAQKALPAEVAFAVKTAALTEFLTAQGVSTSIGTGTEALPAEDLSRLGRDITTLVSCWNE